MISARDLMSHGGCRAQTAVYDQDWQPGYCQLPSPKRRADLPTLGRVSNSRRLETAL